MDVLWEFGNSVAVVHTSANNSATILEARVLRAIPWDLFVCLLCLLLVYRYTCEVPVACCLLTNQCLQHSSNMLIPDWTLSVFSDSWGHSSGFTSRWVSQTRFFSRNTHKKLPAGYIYHSCQIAVTNWTKHSYVAAHGVMSVQCTHTFSTMEKSLVSIHSSCPSFQNSFFWGP